MWWHQAPRLRHYRHCRHPNPTHHEMVTRNTLPAYTEHWLDHPKVVNIMSISNSTPPRGSHPSLTIVQRGAQVLLAYSSVDAPLILNGKHWKTVLWNTTVEQTEWNSPRCLPRLNLAYFFWPQRQAAGHVRCSSTEGDALNFKFRPLPTLFQTHDSLADFHFPQVEDFLARTICNLFCRFLARCIYLQSLLQRTHTRTCWLKSLPSW